MHSKTFDRAVRQYRQDRPSDHRRSSKENLPRTQSDKGTKKLPSTFRSNLEKLASPDKLGSRQSSRRSSHSHSRGNERPLSENAEHNQDKDSYEKPSQSHALESITTPEFSDKMRQRFEALPPLILEEMHLLREQMRYFLVANGHTHGWNQATDETGMRAGKENHVPESLRDLLEEMTKKDGMSDAMKEEIWEDEYARNVSVFYFYLGLY
jgi:hypothetical protein